MPWNKPGWRIVMMDLAKAATISNPVSALLSLVHCLDIPGASALSLVQRMTLKWIDSTPIADP
jgi:hypothetical protein